MTRHRRAQIRDDIVARLADIAGVRQVYKNLDNGIIDKHLPLVNVVIASETSEFDDFERDYRRMAAIDIHLVTGSLWGDTVDDLDNFAAEVERTMAQIPANSLYQDSPVLTETEPMILTEGAKSYGMIRLRYDAVYRTRFSDPTQAPT